MSVTVCIPSYNGERFIAATLHSILAQTLQDFECVVMDDASTDATVEVVAGVDDPRIRLYRNSERVGVAGNRNRCLALARTPYVYLIDQDDLMHPDNLARKVDVLRGDPAISFVHSTAEVLEEGKEFPIPNYWSGPADYVADGNTYFRKLLLEGNRVCSCSVASRPELLRAVGGFDQDINFACDYALWMKLCVNRRVAFLCQPLVRYRWHQRNQTHDVSLERQMAEADVARHRALQYYREASGRAEEAQVLEHAWASVRQRQLMDLLERARHLEGDLAGLRAQAGELQAALAAYQASRWVRLGVYCKKFLPLPRRHFRAAA
jgi:glycosyltransferase involved in cell wall biosynthesis